MKRLFLISIWMLAGLACNEQVVEKPEDLIARDKMVDILYDLSLLNAGKALDPDALKEKQLQSMDYIYRKYDIDSAQYASSDLYYASVPLEYEAIYRALENRLEEQRIRVEEERAQRSDSARQRTLKKTPVVDSLKD